MPNAARKKARFTAGWNPEKASLFIGFLHAQVSTHIAAPVGEALIMTGIGLAVAIPAVIAYNICVRFNRTLSNELQDHAHGLLIDTMLQQESTTQKVDVKVTQQDLVGGQV